MSPPIVLKGELEQITLPRLPRGASEQLKLDRDKAIALLVVERGISIEEAVEILVKLLAQVDNQIDLALRLPHREHQGDPPVEREVPGPTQP